MFNSVFNVLQFRLLSHGWPIVTLRLSDTVMEISWRLKDNGITTSTFLGSRDIIVHVTVRFAVGHLLWVVLCDHASIAHRYGDIVHYKSSCTQTDGQRTDGQNEHIFISINVHYVYLGGDNVCFDCLHKTAD